MKQLIVGAALAVSAVGLAACGSGVTATQFTEQAARTAAAIQYPAVDGSLSKCTSGLISPQTASTQLDAKCGYIEVYLLYPGTTSANWAKDSGAFCGNSVVTGTYNSQVWVADVSEHQPAIAQALGGTLFQPC